MEFNYFPLAVRQDKERQTIPGAVVISAPRAAHRHRKDDLLAVLLSPSGDHRYEGEEVRRLAEDAANIFFGAQGSVTRAMGLACEETNRKVLERNIDRGYEGVRAGGSIALATLHNGWLFVCLFGKTNAFLISSDKFEELGKAEGDGETLGQSKRIFPRFYQSEVRVGDLILINSQPPSTWSAYHLAGGAALTMEQLKRRLLNQVTGEFEAIVIKAGEGEIKVNQREWALEMIGNPAVDEFQEKTIEQESPINLHQREPEKTVSSIIQMPPPSSGKIIDQASMNDNDHLTETDPDETVPVLQGASELDELSDRAGRKNSHLDEPKPFIVKLARTWMGLRTFISKMHMGTDRFRKKIAPNSRPLLENAPPLFSLILALVIPLALVVLSISAYTRIGRTEQFEFYMARAQETANLARIEKDSVIQHGYWASTLESVKSAEKYHVTQDSRMLYEQAQFLLDDMDLAARLDFRPALTQFFPEGMVLTRFQATSSGVYILDRTSGSILRIFLNNKGFYEIDDEFNCQPGSYGLVTVFDLVDFVALPANKENFRIMAVDDRGTLLYCRPGELSSSQYLAAPESGWGRIAGITLDDNILYVLDADQNSVWLYVGRDPDSTDFENSTGVVYPENPIRFFDDEVPDLGGALDLVVNQLDVFLLHQDGHMTACRYGPDKEVRKTECQDPAPFTDNRVGREDKKPWIFPDAEFLMLQATRLPDASIYMLDAASTSLYQFSYQLNLEHVMRPLYNRSYPLPETKPSGFGISPDLELFLAFDNQLFIAPLR
jgi:hypothetical protein